MMTKVILGMALLFFSFSSFTQRHHKTGAALPKQKTLAVHADSLKGSTFTIAGKLQGTDKKATIYLNYAVHGQIHTESAKLVHGKFFFHGKIEDVAIGMMTLSHDGTSTGDDDRISFDFGPEHIYITSQDSLCKAVVKGSRIYQERKEFETLTAPNSSSIYLSARKKEKALSAEDQETPARLAALKIWEQEQKTACKKRLMDYIDTHPDSRYSVDALRELFYVFGTDISDLEAKYNKLNADAKSSYQGKTLARWFITKKAIHPGSTAPLLTSKTPDGRNVSISDFRHHWLLLEFWASWCTPCRAESPNLAKQYQLYKNKGFEILSFSADNDKSAWLRAIAKDSLTWTQISDLGGMNGSKVIDLYGVDALPFNVLISPEGKIAATNLRREELNKRLQQIFEEGTK